MANPVKPHAFELHKLSCSKCASVDIAKPATLANCCFPGAPLLRDYLHALKEPEVRKQAAALKRQFTQQDGKSYNTTKKKLKEVTKYK